MSAIVTNEFKFDLMDTLYSEADSSQNIFYLAFGRTKSWDSSDVPETPINSIEYEMDTRDRLQSAKKVSAYSRVATRYNWSSGSIYDAYTDNASTTNAYYVMTDENKVYMCIQQGRNSLGEAVVSVTKPTTTDKNALEVTTEGYAWKYMYTIGAVPANNFLSANYIPVRLYDSDTAVESYETEQLEIQNAASAGQIAGIEITNAGSGYTTAPITITGDGSGAAATATISSGQITKIEIDETSGTFSFGSGYTRATVSIGGDGSGATAKAIISKRGIGADPTKDLKSTAIMYHTKVDGAESNDFIVDNDFRQIVLLKNPKKPNDSDFTDQSGIIAKRLQVQAGYSTAPSNDATIEGSTSGAKGIVDNFDEDNLIIWYHQTSVTGYESFQAEEDLVGLGMTLDSASVFSIDPDINNLTGDLVYIDNKSPVNRASDQTDDVKAIIKI